MCPQTTPTHPSLMAGSFSSRPQRSSISSWEALVGVTWIKVSSSIFIVVSTLDTKWTLPDGREQDDNPGNAQPRPDTHPLNSLYRGVSRISARGVLKVRPHTKSGPGGGNSLQVRYEKCVCVCGGGGGCSRLRRGGGRSRPPLPPPPPPPPPGSYASETVYNFDQEGAHALRE